MLYKSKVKLKTHRSAMPVWYDPSSDRFSTTKSNSKSILMKHPASICLQSSVFCNFSCFFCLSQSSPLNLPPNEDWISTTLDRLKSLFGICRIDWTGGEPTLLKGLENLLEKSSLLGNFNILTTNGAKFIASEHISHVNFSFYGDNENQYLERTGKRHFSKAMTSLGKYVDYFGNRVNLSLILGVLSVDEILRIIELTSEKTGVLNFKIRKPVSTTQFKAQAASVFKDSIKKLNTHIDTQKHNVLLPESCPETDTSVRSFVVVYPGLFMKESCDHLLQNSTLSSPLKNLENPRSLIHFA